MISSSNVLRGCEDSKIAPLSIALALLAPQAMLKQWWVGWNMMQCYMTLVKDSINPKDPCLPRVHNLPHLL